MKKSLIVFVLSLLAFLFINVGSVSAKVLSNEKGVVNVAKSEVVNDDLFIGGQVVQVDGVVNGDVFAGGETVNVDGVVNGNLHIGGSAVNLSGTVKGNIYVGAGSINVSKLTATGSLIAGSGNFSIDKGSTIGGSLIVGAGNTSIDGKIKRNLMLGTGSATIGPDIKIAKDFYYAVGNQNQDLVIPAGAVGGNVYKSTQTVDTKRAEDVKKEIGSAVKTARVASLVGGFLSALLVGFLYLNFFKDSLVKASDLVCNSFWKSLGVGFLIIMLTIPGLIVLLITIIGIPLAGILFLMFLIGLYLAKVVVGFAIGTWMVDKFKWTKVSSFWALALGLLVVYVFKLIPVVNIFFGIVVTWSGLGALAVLLTSKSK